MKYKLKPWVKFTFLGIASILLILILLFITYKVNTSRVSKNSEYKDFTVEAGSTYISIAKKLKESKLIKSEFFYKVYIKLHNSNSLKTGKYKLSENMSVKEIVLSLSKNSKNDKSIVFKEGINMRKIASIIASSTDNIEDDVYNALNDEDYLNQLINKYWFIKEDIKNKEIYYSLEGYLFPDTYNFSKGDTVYDIFNAMLDNMSEKLEPYKDKIVNSSYSPHQILTLASIIELEAANSDDRSGVAGVFYNRLKANWSLGSDVTTYYGAKVDLSERDLYQKELTAINWYNTRSSSMAGKLPVGPICMPSIQSIEATINPTSHNYYYFVADKNKKTYFSRSSSEHDSTVAKLKEQNLWYEY